MIVACWPQTEPSEDWATWSDPADDVVAAVAIAAAAVAAAVVGASADDDDGGCDVGARHPWANGGC
jgi:hypothetical protein